TISPLIGAAAVLVMSQWNASVVRSMVLSNSTITLLLAAACVVWLPRHEPLSSSLGSKVVGLHWLAQTSPNSGESPGQPTPRGVNVQISWRLDGWSAWSALALSLTVWAAFLCSGSQDESQLTAHSLVLTLCHSMLLGSFFSTDAIVSLVLLQLS